MIKMRMNPKDFYLEISRLLLNRRYGLASNGFILHEMSQIFMYELGYTPILKRSFEETPLYSSVEWQVIAITGGTAMTYDETEGLSVLEIMKQYKVSKRFCKGKNAILKVVVFMND